MADDIRLSVSADTTQMERNIADAARRVGTITLNANIDSRGIESFSRPLGRITGQADEFTKSMDAANARVLAFGASVGTINLVSSAFKNLISSTNEVEESLNQIKTVGGETFSNLKEVSAGIFDVAKKVGVSFKDAAEATLEFSRQGKTLSESLEATKSALVLTRITGLDAAESVKGLTAAVNVFNDAGLTMAQVVNKLSAVDTAFAVSSRDLIEGISRSASVAQEAGVSFDELIAFITTLQEKTGRGGPVIGNALKTIFTRVQNPEIINDIQKLGIAVTDASGQILPATQIIKSLASEFNNLDGNVRKNLLLKVGGGFQIDKLSAVLNDVAEASGKFQGSLNVSASAVDQADKKIKILNQTLSASSTNLATTFKELGSNVGAITFSKDFTNVIQSLDKKLSSVNKFIFGSQEDGQDSGNQFAQSFLKGLGSVISGPGLALFLGVVGKGLIELTKFGASAIQTQLGITTKSKEEQLIQTSISNILLSNRQAQEQLFALEGNKVQQAQLLLGAYRQQAEELQKINSLSKNVSPILYQQGVRLGGGSPEIKSSASGYVPNLAGAISKEKSEAPAGSKIIIDRNFPMGGGQTSTMVYNSNETRIKNFAGTGGDAIIPNYPISSAGGFVPNFAKKNKENRERKLLEVDASNLSVAGLTFAGENDGLIKRAKPIPIDEKVLNNYSGSPYVDVLKQFTDFTITNVPVGNVYRFRKGLKDSEDKIKEDFVKKLNSTFRDQAVSLILDEISGLGLSTGGGVAKNLSNLKLNVIGSSTAGYIFEEILKIPTLTDAEKVAQYASQSESDFFDIKNLNADFAEAYGLPKKAYDLVELKFGQKELKDGISKKFLNQLVAEGGGANPKKFGQRDTNRAASGYIPNFAESIASLKSRMKGSKQKGSGYLQNYYDVDNKGFNDSYAGNVEIKYYSLDKNLDQYTLEAKKELNKVRKKGNSEDSKRRLDDFKRRLDPFLGNSFVYEAMFNESADSTRGTLSNIQGALAERDFAKKFKDFTPEDDELAGIDFYKGNQLVEVKARDRQFSQNEANAKVLAFLGSKKPKKDNEINDIIDLSKVDLSLHETYKRANRKKYLNAAKGYIPNFANVNADILTVNPAAASLSVDQFIEKYIGKSYSTGLSGTSGAALKLQRSPIEIREAKRDFIMSMLGPNFLATFNKDKSAQMSRDLLIENKARFGSARRKVEGGGFLQKKYGEYSAVDYSNVVEGKFSGNVKELQYESLDELAEKVFQQKGLNPIWEEIVGIMSEFGRKAELLNADYNQQSYYFKNPETGKTESTSAKNRIKQLTAKLQPDLIKGLLEGEKNIGGLLVNIPEYDQDLMGKDAKYLVPLDPAAISLKKYISDYLINKNLNPLNPESREASETKSASRSLFEFLDEYSPEQGRRKGVALTTLKYLREKARPNFQLRQFLGENVNQGAFEVKKNQGGSLSGFWKQAFPQNVVDRMASVLTEVYRADGIYPLSNLDFGYTGFQEVKDAVAQSIPNSVKYGDYKNNKAYYDSIAKWKYDAVSKSMIRQAASGFIPNFSDLSEELTGSGSGMLYSNPNFNEIGGGQSGKFLAPKSGEGFGQKIFYKLGKDESSTAKIKQEYNVNKAIKEFEKSNPDLFKKNAVSFTNVGKLLTQNGLLAGFERQVLTGASIDDFSSRPEFKIKDKGVPDNDITPRQNFAFGLSELMAQVGIKNVIEKYREKYGKDSISIDDIYAQNFKVNDAMQKYLIEETNKFFEQTKKQKIKGKELPRYVDDYILRGGLSKDQVASMNQAAGAMGGLHTMFDTQGILRPATSASKGYVPNFAYNLGVNKDNIAIRSVTAPFDEQGNRIRGSGAVKEAILAAIEKAKSKGFTKISADIISDASVNAFAKYFGTAVKGKNVWDISTFRNASNGYIPNFAKKKKKINPLDPDITISNLMYDDPEDLEEGETSDFDPYSFIAKYKGHDIGELNTRQLHDDNGVYVEGIEIDEDFRNRGIGKALYTHLKKSLTPGSKVVGDLLPQHMEPWDDWGENGLDDEENEKLKRIRTIEGLKMIYPQLSRIDLSRDGAFKLSSSREGYPYYEITDKTPKTDPAYKALIKRAKYAADAGLNLVTYASKGYIPNFAGGAIGDAIMREKMQSGLPSSQISLTQDSRLANNLNPSGFAVINKRDEPNGKVPTGRIADAYRNAGKGFIPNFADDPTGKLKSFAEILENQVKNFFKIGEEAKKLNDAIKKYTDIINQYAALSEDEQSILRENIAIDSKLEDKKIKSLFSKTESVYTENSKITSPNSSFNGQQARSGALLGSAGASGVPQGIITSAQQQIQANQTATQTTTQVAQSTARVAAVQKDLESKLLDYIASLNKNSDSENKILDVLSKYNDSLKKLDALNYKLIEEISKEVASAGGLKAGEKEQVSTLLRSSSQSQEKFEPSKQAKQTEKSLGDFAGKLLIWQSAISFASGAVSSFGKEAEIAAQLVSTLGQTLFTVTQGLDLFKNFTKGKGFGDILKGGIEGSSAQAIERRVRVSALREMGPLVRRYNAQNGITVAGNPESAGIATRARGFIAGAGGIGNTLALGAGAIGAAAIAGTLAFKGLDSILKLTEKSATKTSDAIAKMTELQSKYSVSLTESQKGIVERIKSFSDVDAAGLKGFDFGNIMRSVSKSLGGEDQTYINDLRNALRQTGMLEGGNEEIAVTLGRTLTPIIEEQLRDANPEGKAPLRSDLFKAVTEEVTKSLNNITSAIDEDIKTKLADKTFIDQKIKEKVGDQEYSRMKSIFYIGEGYDRERVNVMRDIQKDAIQQKTRGVEKFTAEKFTSSKEAEDKGKARDAVLLFQTELFKKQLELIIQIQKIKGQLPSIDEARVSIQKDFLQLTAKEKFDQEILLKKLQDQRSLENEVKDLYQNAAKSKIDQALENLKPGVPEPVRDQIKNALSGLNEASSIEELKNVYEEISKIGKGSAGVSGVFKKELENTFKFLNEQVASLEKMSSLKAQLNAQDVFAKTLLDKNNAAVSLQKDLLSAQVSARQKDIELQQKQLDIQNKIADASFKIGNISKNPNEDPFVAQRREQLRNINLPAQRELQAFDFEKQKARQSDLQMIFNTAMQKGATPAQLQELAKVEDLDQAYEKLTTILNDQGNNFEANVVAAGKYFHESMIGTAVTVRKLLTDEYAIEGNKIYNKKELDAYKIAQSGEGPELGIMPSPISQDSFISDASKRLMDKIQLTFDSKLGKLSPQDTKTLYAPQSGQLVDPTLAILKETQLRAAEFNNSIAKKYFDLDRQRLENSITLAQRALDIEKQRTAEQLKLEQTKFEGKNALEFNPIKQQLNQAKFQQDFQVKSAKIEDDQNQRSYLLESRKAAMNYAISSFSDLEKIQSIQGAGSTEELKKILNEIAVENVNKIGGGDEFKTKVFEASNLWLNAVTKSVEKLTGVGGTEGAGTAFGAQSFDISSLNASTLPSDPETLKKLKQQLDEKLLNTYQGEEEYEKINELQKQVNKALQSSQEQLRKRIELANSGALTSTILPAEPYAKTPGTIAQGSEEYKNAIAKLKSQTTFSGGLAEAKGQIEGELMTFPNTFGKNIALSFRDGMRDAFKELASGDSTTPLKDRLLGVANSFLQKISDGIMNRAADGLTNMILGKFSAPSGPLSGDFGGGSGGGTSFLGFASGGKISGGSGNKDDVPAMLMGGEYVIKKSAVNKYGTSFLDSLNDGKISKYASGGRVFDEFSLNQSNYEQYSKSARFTDFQDKGLSFNKEGAVTNIQDYSGSEEAKANELMKRQTAYYKATQQTGGKDGFFAPGKFGTGAIVGQKNLLAFATQQATSSKYDKAFGSKDKATIDLVGDSKNLTTAALLDETNIRNTEVQEAKQKALDLYLQGQISNNERVKMDYENQKRYEKEMEEYKKKLKQERKQMYINLAITAAGALAGAGAFGSGIQSIMKGGIGKIAMGTMSNSASTLYSSGNESELPVRDIGSRMVSDESGDTEGPPTYSWMKKSNPFSSISSLFAGRTYANGGLVLNKSFSDKNIFSFLGGGGSVQNNKSNITLARFASGGMVQGNGYGDNVPSLLTGGEFVINKDSAQKIGYSNLNNLNSSNSISETSNFDTSAIEQKLEELIQKITENKQTPNIVITVNSDKSEKEDSRNGEDKQLAKRIKQSVLEILAQEKRLGGSLR